MVFAFDAVATVCAAQKQDANKICALLLDVPCRTLPARYKLDAIKGSSRCPVLPDPNSAAKAAEVAGEAQCGMSRHCAL
jgi:hypothetical protein